MRGCCRRLKSWISLVNCASPCRQAGYWSSVSCLAVLHNLSKPSISLLPAWTRWAC